MLKKKQMTFALPLLIFIVLFGFLWRGLALNPHVIRSVLIDKPVPRFQAQTLQGDKDTINNRVFKGQISLLHVWASWCSVCRVEQPEMMKLSKNDQFQLIGLNYKDHYKSAINFLNILGDPYKINLFDPTGSIGEAFGVYGTPETFLIDRNGIIRDKVVGIISHKIWVKRLMPEIIKLENNA